MQEPLTAEDKHPLTVQDILLGGILVGLVQQPEVVEAAVAVLRPQHFISKVSRAVFEAIVELCRAGTGVDLVTVYNQLRQSDQLGEAGGAARLAVLWDEACNPTWVPGLVEAAIQRELREASQSLAPESNCGPHDADTSFDFGANAISESSEQRRIGDV